MLGFRSAALVAAGVMLFSGCVVQGEWVDAGSTPGAGADSPPLATQLETQWQGVANQPPPTVEQLEDRLPGGFLLMSSTEGDRTEVLALDALGNPIGKLVVFGHAARGLAWHSAGFLALGGIQMLHRIELDGAASPLGWPRPVNFRPTEGLDGQLWLAEEEDVEAYPPEVLYEGGEDWEGPPPELPPEDEPAPCFMDVAAEGEGVLALEVIAGEVLAEDGVVEFEGVPDDVESIAFHDGSLWFGAYNDERLWRDVDGGLVAQFTTDELGFPGYGVAALDARGNRLFALLTRDGIEDGGAYAIVELGGPEPVLRSRGGGAWLDLAAVTGG